LRKFFEDAILLYHYHQPWRLAGLSLYPHGKEQELLRSRIDQEEQPLRLFSTLHMTNNPLQGDVTTYTKAFSAVL
jgi:hypothetical protein